MDENHDVHARLRSINHKTVAALWGILLWAAGTIFWAGAAYEKFQSMDRHAQSMDSHIRAIDDKFDAMNSIKAELLVVQQRQEDYMERIKSLEEFVMRQEGRGVGGVR